MSHFSEVQHSKSGLSKAGLIMKADKKHDIRKYIAKLKLCTYVYNLFMYISIIIYHILLKGNCLSKIRVSLIHVLYFMAQEKFQGFKKSI